MSARRIRGGWASRGTLSGVCCSLPVDGPRLSGHLAEFGPLRIAPPPGTEPALLCEFWTIREGRALAAGMDLGEQAERFVSACAGLTGSILGANLGLLAGFSAGRRSGAGSAFRSGAGAGFERMSTLVTKPMRDLIRAVSLRPYHELMLAVPNVCIGDDPTRHLAVLDMVTDSSLALGIDRFFKYGYGKRLGEIAVMEPGEWTVSVEEATAAEAHLREESAIAADVGRFNEWWAQPLLAGLHDERWARSSVQRRIDDVATRWAPVSGSVSVVEELGSFGLDGECAVGAEPQHGTAVAFHGVKTRISYPRPVRR